jgi:hypothetical protein
MGFGFSGTVTTLRSRMARGLSIQRKGRRSMLPTGIIRAVV